jgi:RimJ/RimL family protein N-acetyltransferase
MLQHLLIYTESPDVLLREFLSDEDDATFFQAVNENREHLSQLGDATSRRFQTVEDVRRSRLRHGTLIRLGIWHTNGQLLGAITATPYKNKHGVEIGYWLRASAVGNGYATIAVQAFTSYLRSKFGRVFAEVHIENTKSKNVLLRAGYVSTEIKKQRWGVVEIFTATQ